MKICHQDGALLLHWEVWLATLTPPPSIFLPPPRFCSSGHHHQYSHTLRPNLSLSRKTRNSFHKISFLPILHHSIWYSRLIHEYLIFPFRFLCHQFWRLAELSQISHFSILLDPGKFYYYWNSCQQLKKGETRNGHIFRNWHSIVGESGFSTNRYFLKYYWLFTRWAVLNVSNIHEVTKALLPALPSIKALSAGGQM